MREAPTCSSNSFGIRRYAYNRLEARPRAHDFTRSLRAEVRDPLWMLTRQWQMGEFAAEDAGSPVDARLVARRLTVDRVGSVRAHRSPTTTRCRSRRWSSARPFRSLLRSGCRRRSTSSSFTRPPYVRSTCQGIATPSHSRRTADDFRGQVDGLNFHHATRRPCFDGEHALRASTTARSRRLFPSTPPIGPPFRATSMPSRRGSTGSTRVRRGDSGMGHGRLSYPSAAPHRLTRWPVRKQLVLVAAI